MVRRGKRFLEEAMLLFLAKGEREMNSAEVSQRIWPDRVPSECLPTQVTVNWV
jgi:hypothetical protein